MLGRPPMVAARVRWITGVALNGAMIFPAADNERMTTHLCIPARFAENFADLNAGDAGADRIEFAAEFPGASVLMSHMSM